ncbi:MAG: cytochrome c oxidase assembly protein [Anaerolineae bacterium]
MDPVLKAALLSWGWRADVIVLLAVAGTLYSMGWRRLRRRIRQRPGALPSGRWQLSSAWRLTAYLSGLLLTGIALMSPLDTLGAALFTFHMIQHLLLIMIAPPLLMVANPMPFMLWGLPAPWRRKVGRALTRLLNSKAPFRRNLRKVTTPGIIWMAWVVSLLGWHDPNAYNAALRHELVHDVEHLTFFLAGMLFWWHVTGAGPRIHKRFGPIGRIAFLLSAIPPNMLIGVAIAFAREPIYTYYLDAPRLWGLTVMMDQQLGGVIMWVPGSMMYIIAALVLAARLLEGDDQKPALPEQEWGMDEALLAPGLEDRSN